MKPDIKLIKVNWDRSLPIPRVNKSPSTRTHALSPTHTLSLLKLKLCIQILHKWKLSSPVHAFVMNSRSWWHEGDPECVRLPGPDIPTSAGWETGGPSTLWQICNHYKLHLAVPHLSRFSLKQAEKKKGKRNLNSSMVLQLYNQNKKI